MPKYFLAPLAAIAALSLVGCSESTNSSSVRMGEFKKIEDFNFTSQDGTSVTPEDLKGKIWVANFIFTSCTAECLILSARFAELQRLFRDNDQVAFVSFSVDPQTDTPERLDFFSKRWHADSERWHFLTGAPDEMDSIIKGSFLLPITRKPEELKKLYTENLIHTSKFAIVDQTGVVRAYVDGLPEESVSSISRIIVQLLQEPVS